MLRFFFLFYGDAPPPTPILLWADIKDCPDAGTVRKDCRGSLQDGFNQFRPPFSVLLCTAAILSDIAPCGAWRHLVFRAVEYSVMKKNYITGVYIESLLKHATFCVVGKLVSFNVRPTVAPHMGG